MLNWYSYFAIYLRFSIGVHTCFPYTKIRLFKNTTNVDVNSENMPFKIKKSVTSQYHSLIFPCDVGSTFIFRFAHGKVLSVGMCFPVRGRSWFHWWRNLAILLWGHGRLSRENLPRPERPGIAHVQCANVWVVGSVSRVTMPQNISRNNILRVSVAITAGLAVLC